MIRRHLGEKLARMGAPLLFSFDKESSPLHAILVDFATGIGCGLEGLGGARLQRFEDAIVWHRRSFFREGYAFALAGRTAVTSRHGNPEARNGGVTPFRMMHYTGYGFWNGCAETLYAPRLAEEAVAWSDVADYPLLYPFLVGGRSFGRLIRAKAVAPQLIASFEREPKPVLIQAAWHGAGRALWFRTPGRRDALLEAINVHPPATKAMLLGLGFAMTYTQIAMPVAVMETIRSMPQDVRHDLRVGAGVALAALIHEMPEEENRVRSLYGASELRPYLDHAAEAEQQTVRDGNWYEAFNAHLAPAPLRADAAS